MMNHTRRTPASLQQSNKMTTSTRLLLLLLLLTFLPALVHSQHEDPRPEDDDSSSVERFSEESAADDEAEMKRQQELELKKLLGKELQRAQELERGRKKPSTQLEEPRYDSVEQSGEDDRHSGEDQRQSGEDESQSGDQETISEEAEAQSGDAESQSGEEETNSSDEESNSDDQETNSDDQESNSGGEDAKDSFQDGEDEAGEPFVYNAYRDNFYDLEHDGSYVYGYAAPHGVRRYERGFHSHKHKGLIVEGFYTQPRHFGHRLLYELRCYRSDIHGFKPLKVAYLHRPPVVRRGVEPDVDCFDHH